MESPPYDIKEVIREKLRGYGVPEEKITHSLKEETQFVLWVKVMLALAKMSSKLTLAFDQERRRKWKLDYIEQLRCLLTLRKYDLLISKLGHSKDDLSREINDLDDEFGQIENGRASRRRILITTAKYVLVGLRAIGLRQGQAIDFLYDLFVKFDVAKIILQETDNRILKKRRLEAKTILGGTSMLDTVEIDDLKAKDRIRKWHDEAWRILKNHPNLF